MYATRRHLAALLSAALLLAAFPAHAWVETRITAHAAVVDVEPNGSATVTHEVGLRLRGGPLKELQIQGVDGDAEPISDATVICTDDPKFGTVPLTVERREDGSLQLAIEREKGLRTGSYVFRFGYRSQFLKRELIRRVGSRVELHWVGPRFEDGLDSARVTFRIPEANVPPSLPDADAAGGAVSELDELGGVFVGNLRRSPGKDELEIVRPHVARGEPPLWRVRVADTAFEGFAVGVVPGAKPALLASSREPGESPRERVSWLAGALFATLTFGLLLTLKWRGFQALAAQRGTCAGALVPLPIGLRATLGGAFLGLAVLAGGRWDEPTLVGAMILGAMACATLFAKPGRPAPRGPGQWLPLSERDAFAARSQRSPGRFLDGGSLPGALVLGAATVTLLALHWFARLRSPYRAMELLLVAGAVLPVFLTGRSSELPVTLGTDPRNVLKRLLAELRRRGVRALPLARLPRGDAAPDELRLLLQPRGALAGLTAIEVGVDYTVGLGGPIAEPYVLVRVREGSACLEALAPRLAFQRGRKPEERVAVLRPKLPTISVCSALIAQLLLQVTATKPRATQAPTKPASSSGRLASARNPDQVPAPTHAI